MNPHVSSRTWLSAARRQRELAVLADGDRSDVLVVGGGVVGAGVALDAASRGLSVTLLERGDLAAGTSSASSKLAHGGLRYLARGELALAYESAHERALLLSSIAPHLTRPLPFLTPYGPGFDTNSSVRPLIGVRAADLLRRAAGTRRNELPPPRRVTPAEALLLTPAISDVGLRGAVEHWDGQLTDDARLVIALARTAAGYGARIITRCAVERIDNGQVTVRDALTGERFETRARAVVNAAGVWAGRLDPAVQLRPSKGAHLVVRAAALGDPRAALTVGAPGGGNRFVFALPHLDGTVHIGLTDVPVPGAVPDTSTVDDADTDFLLAAINRALRIRLDRSDVVGSYAGMRPLLADAETADTADLSRRHVIIDSDDGPVTVVGGKLTTYRRMASDAVNRVVTRYGLPAGRCRTARLPLVGAAPPARLATVAAPTRLVRRYGAEATDLLALADGDPALLRPIAEGVPVLAIELHFGLLAEGALDADDLLTRRVRASFVAEWAAAVRPAAEDAVGSTLTAE